MRIAHKHYMPPVDSGPDLFSPPAVMVDTSLAAAAKIAGHTQRIREAIFLWIRTQGSHGATEREISTALGLNSSTTRPRLRELEGDAPWCHGRLARRIERLSAKRDGMRIYQVVGV